MKFSKSQKKSIMFYLIIILFFTILLTYNSIKLNYYLNKDGKYTYGVVQPDKTFTKAESVQYIVNNKKYFLVTSNRMKEGSTLIIKYSTSKPYLSKIVKDSINSKSSF